MTKKGYYRKEIYQNTPETEKYLFQAAIKDIIIDQEKIFGIEIGVLYGETTRFLLSLNDKINLVGIDPIVPDSMEATLIGDMEIIKQNIERYKERYTHIKDFSYNVSGHFTNHSQDFIFIDGDHTYKAVGLDYRLYFEKIKKGGLFFFHDSRMNRGGANFHIGSSKFVDELISSDNRLELIGEAFSLTCFRKR